LENDPYRKGHPLAGYHVGPTGFFSLPPDFDNQVESRGVLWMSEPPSSRHTYVIGGDPTVGIPGWTLQNRNPDDRTTDNATIEVIRCGKVKQIEDGKEIRIVREKDVQVAEYAAPIDPITYAGVLNAIGKLYRGNTEEEGCLINFEVGPGPGISVFPELYSRFGYTNIFQQPYLDTPRPKRNIDYGFWSTQQSKQLLWTKGVRHVWHGGLDFFSPWLLEEMVDANADRFVFKRRTGGPSHDDRWTGILLALWAAHSWTMDLDNVEDTQLEKIDSKKPDFQRSLMGEREAHAQAEERWAEILESLGQ